jgi:hypothetical protein
MPMGALHILMTGMAGWHIAPTAFKRIRYLEKLKSGLKNASSSSRAFRALLDKACGQCMDAVSLDDQLGFYWEGPTNYRGRLQWPFRLPMTAELYLFKKKS